MTDEATILVVDDLEQNIRLLEAVLAPRGYAVVTATSGDEALERVRREPVDLVLLDIVMPGMDGYEVCRTLRADETTQFLPIVMITASGQQEKVAAIEAGADDFIAKPFEQAELLARVRSLLRIKRYHDTIEAQAAELAAWNRQLEQRVEEQVTELERARRLRRFLPPQVAELVVSSGDESFLESHRQEITVVFCDLRGFTAFTETVEPEDLMLVLGEYHAALGDLVHRFEGTLDRFTGDGLMAFFNDPLPCPDAPERAVRMAVAMRNRVADAGRGMAPHGPRPGLRRRRGAGPRDARAHRIRGPLRLHRDRQRDEPRSTTVRRGGAGPDPHQPARVRRRRGACDAEPVGEVDLRGFSRPTRVYNVLGLDAARTSA